MSKLEIYKKSIALLMSGFILSGSLVGCKSNKKGALDTETSTSTSSSETTEPAPVDEYAEIKDIYERTFNKVKEIQPDVNDEVSKNTTLILLLDLFTQKDEFGKINSDLISQFKSRLDVDNMISDFNAYLDLLQKKSINENDVKRVSYVLPHELSRDQLILSNIEDIVENIKNYSNEKNKNGVLTEFNKIYTLIVEEKPLKVDNISFEIRELSFPARAVANNLAEVAAYYSRSYISKSKYNKIDERANDQNNKAYTKQSLEILANQMNEVSETDVVSLFNNKYESVKKLLSGKVNLSDETIKNLVNYMNIEYLDSDKVSTKDMNQIIKEYDEEKVNDVLRAIDAINEYNLRGNSLIVYSSFLVDNYKNTDTGKIDSITLDFIQSNKISRYYKFKYNL